MAYNVIFSLYSWQQYNTVYAPLHFTLTSTIATITPVSAGRVTSCNPACDPPIIRTLYFHTPVYARTHAQAYVHTLIRVPTHAHAYVHMIVRVPTHAQMYVQ